MERKLILTAMLTALAVLLMLVTASGYQALAEEDLATGIDLQASPNGDQAAVPVSIGLYITNLASIDEARESFEIGCYGFVSWQDHA